MKKIGLEFEFFIKKKESDEVVPAYYATSNLDGDPFIGELRTDPHDSIVDAVYELKKLLYLERVRLSKKGFLITDLDEYKFSDHFIKEARKSKRAVSLKQLEALEVFSVYPRGKTDKVLPRGMKKVSLQVNMNNVSTESIINERIYQGNIKESKRDYHFSKLFNFQNIIFHLDNCFKEDIKESKRCKGLYSIKEGVFGDRIEYRSLPASISLFKLIKHLESKF